MFGDKFAPIVPFSIRFAAERYASHTQALGVVLLETACTGNELIYFPGYVFATNGAEIKRRHHLGSEQRGVRFID